MKTIRLSFKSSFLGVAILQSQSIEASSEGVGSFFSEVFPQQGEGSFVFLGALRQGSGADDIILRSLVLREILAQLPTKDLPKRRLLDPTLF